MIILDTNVLSHIQKDDPYGVRIGANLAAVQDRQIRITTISTAEVLEGAVLLVTRERKARTDDSRAFQLIQAYRLLDEVVHQLVKWDGRTLPYVAEADRLYRAFAPRIRQELKADARIAAIAKIHDATVWTRNVRDFTKIPGLAVVDALTGVPIQIRPDPS